MCLITIILFITSLLFKFKYHRKVLPSKRLFEYIKNIINYFGIWSKKPKEVGLAKLIISLPNPKQGLKILEDNSKPAVKVAKKSVGLLNKFS